MDEHRHGEMEKPPGLSDAYGVNLKMVVEDVIKFRAALDAQYLSDIARMREIGHEALQNHSMDMRDSKMRKETATEERREELEETFNKNVTSSNEAISGIISILEAAGVLGASQQTSGRTGKGKYD